MNLIPACLDHLHNAIGDRSSHSPLGEIDRNTLEKLFGEIAERPHPVAPGWGNVHSYKNLLFNLANLRNEVRDGFLDRLLSDMALLCGQLPAMAPETGVDLQGRVEPDRRVQTAPVAQTAAVDEKPFLSPLADQSKPDWFDRLLDWSVMLAKGLGLIE